MKKRTLWIGAAVLVVIVAVGAVAMRGKGGKPLEVTSAKAARQKVVQTVSATGKIQPKTKVEISADVSAKITRLDVAEGQSVKKGTFLLELDRDRYLAAVESAEANVSAAQANVALVRENMDKAEKEFGRSKELLAKGVEAPAEFDTRKAAYQVEAARYKSAEDQVQQARASLKQSRDDLSKTTIYAPMSGTVSALNKERGEIALGSQFQKDVILTIADLSQMEAEVNVDENDIVSIAIGQPVEIEVDALTGEKLHGVVSEISSSAKVSGSGTTDQKTEFEIKISIANPPKTLRPGMTASASIITKTNNTALSVPLQSVAVRTVDQLTVKGESRADAEKRYKVDKDGFVEMVFCIEKGKAVARQVTTGIQSDELIEILSGLSEGEEVVSGSYRAISKDLENGAPVTISKGPKKPDMSKPPA